MAAQLTIGQVVDRSGIAHSALRYYEQLGLIASERTSGNQRRYRRSVLRRLAVIQAAQRVGLSLEEIRDAFGDWAPDYAPTKRDWVAVSRRWRPQLDQRIRELQMVRDGLAQCVGCGCLSMQQCAVFNAHDELAATGSGARRVFPHDEPEDPGWAAEASH